MHNNIPSTSPLLSLKPSPHLLHPSPTTRIRPAGRRRVDPMVENNSPRTIIRYLTYSFPKRNTPNPAHRLLPLKHSTLHKGLVLGPDYLSLMGQLTEAMAQLEPEIQATPDGAYIIFHNRKPFSSQHTDFIISIPHPSTYAILATMNTSIKIPLPTLVTIRGQPHH